MLRFEKEPPQIVTYLNYKNYIRELFQNEIQTKLSEFGIGNVMCETFTNSFNDT